MIEKYTTEVPASSIMGNTKPPKAPSMGDIQKGLEEYFASLSLDHLNAFKEGSQYYKRSFTDIDGFFKNTTSFIVDELKKNSTDDQKMSLDEYNKIVLSVIELLKSLKININASICLSSFVGYIITVVRKLYEENKN